MKNIVHPMSLCRRLIFLFLFYCCYNNITTTELESLYSLRRKANDYILNHFEPELVSYAINSS